MLRGTPGADYHFGVAGDARALLEQMRVRLEGGPHAALGIAEGATPQAARAAFLQLTKTYHPAKFARESPEIVAQANEVFLALRAAFDQISLIARRSSQQQLAAVPPMVAGSGRSLTPGLGVPIVAPGGRASAITPGRSMTPAAGVPIVAAPAPATRTPAPTPSRTAGAAATTSRAPTAPATGAAPGARTTAGRPAVGAPGAPSTTQQPTPPSTPVVSIKPSPAGGPTTPRLATRPGEPNRGAPLPRATGDVNRNTPLPRAAPAAPVNPLAGRPPAAAPPASSPAPAPIAPAAQAAGPAPGVVRPLPPGMPPLSPGIQLGTDEANHEIAMFHLRRKQWSEARKVLHELAARDHVDKHFRALLAYARGREAQDAGRHEEARTELQRALQLEPELGVAKSALAQLATPEEPTPSGGGLLSRLFKK